MKKKGQQYLGIVSQKLHAYKFKTVARKFQALKLLCTGSFAFLVFLLGLQTVQLGHRPANIQSELRLLSPPC